MSAKLLSHPSTGRAIKAYLSQAGAPLMLYGADGGGKRFAAKTIVSEALGLNANDSLEKIPYVMQIEKQAGKQDISISQIRSAKRFLSLKTTGNKQLRRAILIFDAQDMNAEAQNALLKILEEPAYDTLFILTALSPLSVLPTIASRCQQIEIKPISQAAARKYFAHQVKAEDIDYAWNLSQGAVGLLSQLLNTTEPQPLKNAIQQAKSLLALPAYERHIELNRISKNRDELKTLLEALSLILAALHHTLINKSSSAHAERLLADRKLLINSQAYLAANVSAKTISDELILNLNI